MKELRDSDQARFDLANSINLLETLLIDSRHKLEHDYVTYLTANETTHFDQELNILTEWFDENGHGSIKSEIDFKLKQMYALLDPIKRRQFEFTNRPKALDLLKRSLSEASSLLKTMHDFSKMYEDLNVNETSRQSTDYRASFTAIEFQTLDNAIQNTQVSLYMHV